MGSQTDDRARADKLLQELEVHQTELQVQNEELLRTQAQLEDSRDRYYQLYDLAPVTYLSLDRRGMILEANLTATELIGMPRAELVGRTLASLMTPRQADGLHRFLGDVFSSATRMSCELLLRTRDDTRSSDVPVRIDAVAVMRDDAGAERECRAAIIDLSDLRSEVSRRRASEASARLLLDTVADAIITSDDSGRIEGFNRAAQQLFGYGEDEILGRDMSMLLPPSRRDEHRARLRNELTTLDAIAVVPAGRETLGLRKDGTTFSMEIRIGERRVGTERKLVVAVQDLTQQRLAAQEKAALTMRLHQSQKLQAVGTLAAGVAHDFNNLLMGIGGCADVALDVLASDSPARSFIDEIKRSAESGIVISRQLLTFSRERDVSGSVCALDDVIDSTEQMLARLLGEDVTLLVHLGTKGRWLRSDAGHIEQLLVNLAVNARDAMPRGGQLLVETEALALAPSNEHGLAAGDYLLLRIADTGVGMNAETQRRIFEPFYSTKEASEGNGLGLWTVWGVVEQAGGTIDVHSTVGEGTTFELVFPAAPPPDAVAERASIEAPSRDCPVLVVEDDAIVRMATCFYLQRAGYAVLEAASGRAAIERLRETSSRVEVLITDVVLPEIDGPELARQALELLPDLAVIYMSAHAQQWLVEQGRLDENQRTLQKPFSAEELLAHIDDVRARQHANADERRGGSDQ